MFKKTVESGHFYAQKMLSKNKKGEDDHVDDSEGEKKGNQRRKKKQLEAIGT